MALFQQERISLSRASKIAGIELIDFQKLLADRNICVHYDVEDFEQDVQHLRDQGDSASGVVSNRSIGTKTIAWRRG